MIKPNRHSVFYRWLISYALILIIPIVLCASILVNAQSVLLKEYDAGSASVRALSSRLIDASLDRAYTAQSQLSYDETLSQFVNYSPPYTGAQRYLLVNLKKYLYNRAVYATDADRLEFVYFSGLNAALDYRSLYDLTLLSEVYFSGVNDARNTLSAIFARYNNQTIEVLPKADGDVVVMLLSSVPRGDMYGYRATTVQLLDNEMFTALFEDNAIQTGMNMYLVDENGAVISASGTQELVAAFLKKHALAQLPQCSLTIDGNEYLVSVDKSTISKWYYITFISRSELS